MRKKSHDGISGLLDQIWRSVRDWLKREFEDEDKSGIVFNQVRIDSQVIVKGDIKMVKMEFDQYVDITVEAKDRKGNPASIEAGSAVWSVIAVDVDGNEVDGALTIEPNADNELAARLTASGAEEVTGVVTFRADGDADADEEAFVVGTLSVVVDSPNATVFELTAGTPADVVAEPAPEPTPEPAPAEEDV